MMIPFRRFHSVDPGSIHHKTRKYGQKFAQGFAQFKHSEELYDVLVVAPDGQEYRLHMLLLAYHSEFFRAMFNNEFRESKERRVVLKFDDPLNVWPIMVEYFYTEEVTLTDDTALALYAVSRELMVPRIQEYCAEFAQTNLDASNALEYLCKSVQFNCDGFRQSCIRLVAESFPACFNKGADGLPVEVVLEVLQHPLLLVQCEEQVLSFLLSYVSRHALDSDTQARVYSHIQLEFLSNERLARLQAERLVPDALLLPAMATRFWLLDRPERLAQAPPGRSAPCCPRKTYCCSIEYGLPGGSEYAALPLEAVWEDLVQLIQVQVSGESVEGDTESILRPHSENSHFTISSGAQSPPVGIELEFPTNMRVVEITKMTFSHGMNLVSNMFPYGISDEKLVQMKGLQVQLLSLERDKWVGVKTYETCSMQTEYTLTVDAAAAKTARWRRLRILAPPAPDQDTQGAPDSGASSGNRVSIRKLKMYGRVEVSLLSQGAGRDLYTLWRRRRDSRGMPYAGGRSKSFSYSAMVAKDVGGKEASGKAPGR